jgi:transposase-like protein
MDSMEVRCQHHFRVRRDRTAPVLRKLAKNEGNARVARRILGVANALDGMSREAAARSAGMDRQTLRDWVLRYNAYGLDGLADRPRDGRPPKLEADEKAELLQIVLAGCDPETSGLSAFPRDDLVRICEERCGMTLITHMPVAAARIRALTQPHPIKPTSKSETCCRSARQPNPGRQST